MKLERKIIDGAIKKFSEQTTLKCKLHESNDNILIAIENRTKTNSYFFLLAVVVPHITSQNIDWALSKIKKGNENPLLVTRYLSFALSEFLFHKGIQFMDLAGNCFLNSNNLFIYLRGNKLNENDDYREKTNLAFNSGGAVVIFLYLSNAWFANMPVRQVGQIAKVSKGTVSLVNRGLIKLGFLEENNEERIILNYEKLFDRWLISFNEKLKTKILIGRYRTSEKRFWDKLELEKEIISGEAGVKRYIREFQAASGIIYTVNAEDLIKLYKLIPYEDGEIEIREKFWDDSLSSNYTPNIALLIYADILSTRNNLSQSQLSELKNFVFRSKINSDI